LPLHAARPRITGDGRVLVECPVCPTAEAAPAAEVEPATAASPERPVRPRVLLGSTALAVAGLAAIAGAGASEGRRALAPAAGAATVAVAAADVPVVDEGVAVEPVELPAEPARELPPIPTYDGAPLDEWLPTLRLWVHPVPGLAEPLPAKASSRFGAERAGTTRGECGAGHCGVDLYGERGQPVVAVAWGTVARIQNDPDVRGGRYVRIEHPDYVFTSYFHLDDIAPGLAVGDIVEAGTTLGTLGRSGIQVAPAHLHFALELTEQGKVRFADPLPFLARAELRTE
jgi:murein DD-endopeptidase MepM/ murein hydrolase activator NlpD